jgi:hypothetical protein
MQSHDHFNSKKKLPMHMHKQPTSVYNNREPFQRNNDAMSQFQGEKLMNVRGNLNFNYDLKNDSIEEED